MSDDDWAPASASALAEVTGTGERPRTAVEVTGYTELREVARGGDSIVYRARQTSVDRDVAIKVIQVADPAAVARFQRELEITVRLGRQHPHIVTVLDTTTTAAGEPCLVMEFHDLGSLHDRLREAGPLPVSDVVNAGTDVADALAFAHTHGVLHRDVKPQNVLVLPTSYVLSDFGIARMADAGHTATLERFSYRHASPQVLDGLAPTEADDVWSLGSTLFTLLDGRAPFASLDPDEDTALAYLRRVRTGERRQLSRDDVPAELVQLIEDCLISDRDARLGTARDAVRRLRRIRTEDRSWNPAPPGLPEADVPTQPRGEDSDGVSAGAAGSVRSSGPVGAGGPPRTSDTDRSAGEPSGAARPSSDADAAWAPGAVAAPAPAAASPEEPDEPAAVAPSVLAHVTDRPEQPSEPEDPDGDHTGLAPEPEEEPRTRRERRGGGGEVAPWRRIAAFLGGALLVGAAIGVGSVVIRGMGGEPDPTPTTMPDEVPTTTLPTDGSSPPNIQEIDPALSPRQLTIDENRGTALVLSWTEPEQIDAVAGYVVLRTDVDPVVVAKPVELPLTTTTIEGLSPDAQECFRIVAIPLASGAASGISNEVCG